MLKKIGALPAKPVFHALNALGVLACCVSPFKTLDPHLHDIWTKPIDLNTIFSLVCIWKLLRRGKLTDKNS